MQKYVLLFHWLAKEALEVHRNSATILSHCVWVNVTMLGRLVGPTPSPFYVHDVFTLPIDEAVQISGWVFSTPEQDIETSRAIQAAGGVGRAVLFFNLGVQGPDGARFFPWVEKYDLSEPLGPEYQPIGEWAAVFQGIINGDISLADISRVVKPSTVGLAQAESIADDLGAQLEAMEL